MSTVCWWGWPGGRQIPQLVDLGQSRGEGGGWKAVSKDL